MLEAVVMWSDNASEIDLLGYEDLIDDLVTLALDKSLQPLTIGAPTRSKTSTDIPGHRSRPPA